MRMLGLLVLLLPGLCTAEIDFLYEDSLGNFRVYFLGNCRVHFLGSSRDHSFGNSRVHTLDMT